MASRSMLSDNYSFCRCRLYSNLKLALLWVNIALFSVSAHFKCLWIAILFGFVDKGKSNGKMQNISFRVYELNAYGLFFLLLKKKIIPLYLICIWVLVNFQVYLSFLISREQQSNSSKIKRHQRHVRPAAGRTRVLTKPTSVAVFRRPLNFYSLGWFCSPLHAYTPPLTPVHQTSEPCLISLPWI